MKNTKRLLALLLCAALILGLAACGTDPAPTDPPVTEAPGLAVYEEALKALEGIQDVKLNITIGKTTTVAGQEFIEESNQTLVYAGLGTDAVKIRRTDSVNFDGFNTIGYEEVYADGTLYVTVDDSNASEKQYFSGEAAAEGYLPVILLDASRYGSITQEPHGTASTMIHFADPTAPEDWVLPEGAEMVDASGAALISEEGKLQRFNYAITYTYGPAEVTLDVESYVVQESNPVEVPANAADYTSVASIEAIRLSDLCLSYMAQADWLNSTTTDSIFCEAGAVMRNQTVTLDMCYGDDLDAKFVTSLYINDFSTGESLEQKLEELFVDGKYTTAVDGGEPEAVSGVTANAIDTYGQNMMYANTIAMGYWKDAAVTDLGSAYLVECTFDDALGADISANVSYTLYGDPAYLDSFATGSGTKEVKGYLAVDKYTGLPTAAGYNFVGYHTIQGHDFALTYQVDQSIDVPSQAAYHNITGEMLPESKPETLAQPLFYHVTGAEGQEMWLLGTIHVGDERTAYLPQEVYDAFAASDALALEFDSGDFEKQLETDKALQAAISAAYYYADGTTVADHIDAELYETALKHLKASGSYNMNAGMMKPYLWSNAIDTFLLRQGRTLSNLQGVEARLEKLAEDQDKEIRSVESGLFQIEMITGFSGELQEMLLSESVGQTPIEYWQDTEELYELWCAGGEAVLREYLADDTSDLTEEELALYNEYNDAMLLDRNADMVTVATEYLESGDVVFYAVGLAHLLTGNGLVDALRDAGYTVELVPYA